MKSHQSFLLVVVLLLLIPAGIIVGKLTELENPSRIFTTSNVWEVTFEMKMKHQGQKPFMKIYLPMDNDRQKIEKENVEMGAYNFSKEEQDGNLRGIWRAKEVRGKKSVRYNFICESHKVNYKLSQDLPYPSTYAEEMDSYLLAEENIESDDPEIEALAKRITPNSDKLIPVISALFHYVHEIPSIKSSELMSAKDVIKKGKAACNGKSRLFVALCRNLGIPARLVGGIILENGEKRTSHQWTEVFIEGQWVPFDALNGHFAMLPAHYLEIYRGDKFLIAHNKNVHFDYGFTMKKLSPLVTGYDNDESLNFIGFAASSGISPFLLKVLLLMPLAALIVAIFKNVVGIKTFGVFLPALIAASLSGGDLGFGLLSLLLMVGLVAGLHFILDKWGLLYAPKLVIMLSAVIGLNLLLIQLSGRDLIPGNFTALPIIILAITAERFARRIVEDGFKDACLTMAQTLVVTLCCYTIFSSVFFLSLFMGYPELILVIIGLMLLLGKWIGLRVSEYKRFSWILS